MIITVEALLLGTEEKAHISTNSRQRTPNELEQSGIGTENKTMKDGDRRTETQILGMKGLTSSNVEKIYCRQLNYLFVMYSIMYNSIGFYLCVCVCWGGERD